MTLEKLDFLKKEQYCEKVYKRDIVNASNILEKYEQYANTMCVILPVSCYTNFRDALFHFRKMAITTESTEVERQAFAIKEHLARALADAGASIIHHLAKVSECMLRDTDITDDEKKEIRKTLHHIKNGDLRRRFTGMMISNDGIYDISDDEIIAIINDYFNTLRAIGSFAKFAKYLHEENLK